MAMTMRPRMSTAAATRARSTPVVRSAAPQASTPPTSTATTGGYFVVNNVFKVKPESYNDFEELWRTRESHLKEMPGFMRFAMLKCVNVPGKYVSQTTWKDRASFDNWARSPQFQASHSKKEGQSQRPSAMTMVEGPPVPELFETVTITE